jgi:hypothetical protein
MIAAACLFAAASSAYGNEVNNALRRGAVPLDNAIRREAVDDMIRRGAVPNGVNPPPLPGMEIGRCTLKVDGTTYLNNAECWYDDTLVNPHHGRIAVAIRTNFDADTQHECRAFVERSEHGVWNAIWWKRCEPAEITESLFDKGVLHEGTLGAKCWTFARGTLCVYHVNRT